jgi:hypothetical protein
LVAVGLTVPAGAIVAQSASAAAVAKVSCKTATAKAKITPGLYKLQPAAQAKTHALKQKITASGALAGCTGGVTGGTITVTENQVAPVNCNLLLDKTFVSKPPTTGPVVITWAGGKGKTTIGAAKLGGTTPFVATHLLLGGKVTASTGAVAALKGKTLKFVLTFAAVPKTGCVTTNLVAASVKNAGAVTIG